jgi:hypothetical protein
MEARYFQSPVGWVRRVPTGFSWVGFFFGASWAFANRAWLLGIILSVVATPFELLHYAGAAMHPLVALLWLAGNLACMVLVGRYGHRWLAWSLARQGYAEVDNAAV